MTLRVLLVHNRYREEGGEDLAFEADVRLLRAHGHSVAELTDDSQRIQGIRQVGLGVRAIWSSESRRQLAEQIRQARPDIVHFHNTFPLFSPSVYSVAKSHGVPVVQTLHNFRLMCPNALFFRDGHLCEDCMGRFFPWPGVLHACYRHSRVETGVVGTMVSFHRLLGTWARQVDTYIALTDHSRTKFIQGGLPANRVVVRPNFVDPDPGLTEEGPRSFALFVGRLAPEKGVEVLLRAWRSLNGIPLLIIGDGPLSGKVRDLIRSQGLADVKMVGRQPHSEIVSALRGARVLVVPSECYETFSLVVVEAFATGVPVVASRLGSLAEIVNQGLTGLHFDPGSPENLAAQVRRLWGDPNESRAMGRAARREYERRYTPELSYQRLMEIYLHLAESGREGR